MKQLLLVITISIFVCNQSLAALAVQRTVESSYSDYQKYLTRSGGISFAQAYIQISSVTEIESESVEKCLEEIYLGESKKDTCFLAVKALTSKPLNSFRREVLFSFLSKLEKLPSPQRNFYRELRKGILWTHPELARVFHVSVDRAAAEPSNVQELELKAWKKSAGQKFPIEEVSLLINGKKVSQLAKWTAPQGVYQWALISNTHAPLMRLGTFTQFAAESLKDLKPLAKGGCQSPAESDLKDLEGFQLQVFSSSKCLVPVGASQLSASPAPSEHLGSLPSLPSVEPEPVSHSWVVPVLLMVGTALAVGLKGKQVSFQ